MEKLAGYLFAKLDAIGARSEGPVYYIQQYDYKEQVIIKQANLWEEDPVLHPLIAQKIVLLGTVTPEGIEYQKAVPEGDAAELSGSE